MVKTLKLIADQYGASILKDGSKLLAYYADISPRQKADRQMLEYLIKCDGNLKLIDVLHESNQEQQICVDRLVKQMASQLFVSEDAAYTVCNNFLQAIGGGPIQCPTVLTPSHLTKPEEAHSNIPQFNSNHTHQKERKHLKFLFGGIAILLVGVLLVLFLTKPWDSNIPSDQSEDMVAVNTENSVVQANMASWGYAINAGECVYYSDGNLGIYQLKNNQSKLFVEGTFSEMGLVGNTIYCVENVLLDSDAGSRPVVIGINISSGEKRILYTPHSKESQIYGVNVLKEKYYFTVDNDALFSIDSDGIVENTGIRFARKVTESGIYTTDTSTYGLKLLAFDGTTVKTYPDLVAHEVDVCFELGNTVYLQYRTENINKMYRMNKVTGELSIFPSDSFFDNNILSYINQHGSLLYLSTSNMNDDGTIQYKVYSMDLSGNNVKLIHSQVSASGLPFCTLNIVDDYLIVNYPISGIEPHIVNLEHKQ